VVAVRAQVQEVIVDYDVFKAVFGMGFVYLVFFFMVAFAISFAWNLVRRIFR
jgi:hypothetical protein